MTLAFLLTTLVVVATPGTGALYTVATGLAHGSRAAAVAALGDRLLARLVDPPISPRRLPCY